MKYLNPKDTLR